MNRPALQPLEVLQAPLAGTTLVEASAGTGKTWAIAELYVRLLAEKRLAVDQILVVTYTNAATQELNDRIRTRLLASRDHLLAGTSNASCHQWLHGKHINRQQTASLLTQAIRCFDQAAIFTIHGFCQRVLTENAFESGEPFEVQVLSDETDLLQEITDDFWRRELYAAPQLRAAYLSQALKSPEQLLRSVRRYVGKPYLKILTPQGDGDCDEVEESYASAYSQVRALWQTERSEVSELFHTHSGLNRSRYSARAVSGWLATLDDFLAPQEANPDLPKSAIRFTAEQIASATKKGCCPPQHQLFSECDRLLAAHRNLQAGYAPLVYRLKVRLLEFLTEELERRKVTQRLKSYDDLLIGLDRALVGDRGKALVDTLRARYRAALIDEFQDTDPLQYRILGRLFTQTDYPVFLVGDPKQAIYSFRGADVFAYLNAHRAAQTRYTLGVNRRSTAALITAVNTVFENAKDPFLYDDIKFLRAEAAGYTAPDLIVADDRPEPFRIWFMERSEGTTAINKRQAELLCARATAAEVARLLTRSARGEALIGDRRLGGGDIAILVRSHHQGRLMDGALRELGIPCVQQTLDNVFHSWEALELERVLMAIAEPGREPLLRAALVTDMLGVSGEELYARSTAGQDWEDRIETFYRYHRWWREQGFIQMFRQLITAEQVAARLLSYGDGNRRLTNLLHLAELLHSQASGSRWKMEQLLSWFAERRQADGVDSEQAQLRLESDEHLVTLVTIHKAKGLQFPVVFCPFPWDGKEWTARAKEFVFHDPAGSFEPTLDLGSTQQDDHRKAARQEELAEKLRLFYVALTRAQYRCYMTWGAVRDAACSAPAWLFHQLESAEQKPVAERMPRLESALDAKLRADLERLAARSGGAIAIEPLSGPPEQTATRSQTSAHGKLAARSWSGNVVPTWRMTSFSALTKGHDPELTDYGEDRVRVGETEPAGAATFPRGARAGQCLHTVFERLDFTCARAGVRERLIATALREHGFGEEWTQPVAALVERVLTTTLTPSGIRLADVSPGARVNEMPFSYPVAGLTETDLRRLLAAHGFGAGTARLHDTLNGVHFDVTRGFVRGFIDLVFQTDGSYYLVDYKSNWLGPKVSDYHVSVLAQVMSREAYTLQYLLYAIALHRYLEQRVLGYDYDTHFGGVLYLFLRGMDPNRGPQFGVFRDRPESTLITALDSYFRTGDIGTPL
jgi:exodeoxyribonuclease V beta subunit